MFPQVNKEQMILVQQVSRLIQGKIRVDYKEHTINISFTTQDERAKKLLTNIVPSFAEVLAEQLGTFFSIRGEIIDVNKPPG